MINVNIFPNYVISQHSRTALLSYANLEDISCEIRYINKKIMNRLEIEKQRMAVQTNKQNIFTFNIPAHLFDWKHQKGFTAGLRPFRENGVRLQKEEIQNKVIYHNYGYGGCGITIAYGCSLDLLQRQFEPGRVPLGQPIAVLGSGVVGLTTAHLLIQRGYQVRIYASLLPGFQEGKAEMTSTVAAGYWMPSNIGNKSQLKKQVIASWNYFSSLYKIQMQTGKRLGITRLPCYCVNQIEGTMTHMHIEGVIEPEPITVTFGNGNEYPAVRFESYIIQPKLFLPYLLQSMIKTNRLSLHKELYTRESVLRKTEKHIFNCSGMGGHELFGDTSANYGIKGHVVAFDLKHFPEPKKHFMIIKVTQGAYIMMAPQIQGGSLILGASFQPNKSNPFPQEEQARNIVKRARQFFQLDEERRQ